MQKMVQQQQYQQRVAVKAVIVDAKGRVLFLRKSNDDVRHAGKSGRFNLPGGKIEPGEGINEALIREVKEETGLTLLVVSPQPVFVGEWRPVVAGVPYQIIGIFFVCRKWQGDILLNSEHDKYEWLAKEEIKARDILPPEDEAAQAALVSPKAKG